jgi:hypothetical protein
MGDFAREVAGNTGRKSPKSSQYNKYAETGKAYDEERKGYDGQEVEYRYADFPLALGEAIMMNHALFGGLLHARATPITDDPFHNRALSLKLRRAAQDPAVQKVQAQHAQVRERFGIPKGTDSPQADLLAATALTDLKLDLPVLRLPLAEVLEYREKHEAALGEARKKLGWMAQRIEAEPWSDEFAKDLKRKIIPDIAEALSEAGRARNSWLKNGRVRSIVKALGIGVATATVALNLCATPATPIGPALVGLGLVSGTAIPGAEWLLDWVHGRKTMQENGLHYLLGPHRQASRRRRRPLREDVAE